MRMDLSFSQRLILGFVANGVLSAAVVLGMARWPAGESVEGLTMPPVFPSGMWMLGVALACGGVSLCVWGTLFWSSFAALLRMRRGAGQLDSRGAENDSPEGLYAALVQLEASIQEQSGNLARSEEQQRLLISDVAHELCSPLGRMQRALSLAERHASPGAQPYMQKVEIELQHVTRLVEEALSFSKISALPDAEPIQRFHFGELLDSVLNREAAEVSVETCVAENLVLVSRRSALDRAVSNLVRNAIRYAGAFGPIEVHAQQAGDHLTILVMDSGPGLPAELLEKIFQPFYRPDVARHRRTGGAGLGLAIVRSSVEACGGTVEARLREPKGLVFEIQVPAALLA